MAVSYIILLETSMYIGHGNRAHGTTVLQEYFPGLPEDTHVSFLFFGLREVWKNRWLWQNFYGENKHRHRLHRVRRGYGLKCQDLRQPYDHPSGCLQQSFALELP